MSREDQYKAIVAREFARAAVVRREKIDITQVEFDYDYEEIYITSDGVVWTMQIGSDDDEFIFENSNFETIRFPYPKDWIEFEENPDLGRI